MKTASLLLASLANITSAIESQANLCVEGPFADEISGNGGMLSIHAT